MIKLSFYYLSNEKKKIIIIIEDHALPAVIERLNLDLYEQQNHKTPLEIRFVLISLSWPNLARMLRLRVEAKILHILTAVMMRGELKYITFPLQKVEHIIIITLLYKDLSLSISFPTFEDEEIKQN
jgi:hypothetical protein